MDKMTLQLAWHRGRDAREKGHFRASPFYREMRYVQGRMLDITDTLDRCWLAGYDQKPFPEEEL